MKISFSEIEPLFPGYFSGDLSDSQLTMIDNWRSESSENESLYLESLKAWESTTLLNEMEHFNSFEALKKVNSKISQRSSSKWWITIQRAAAIFILPLLLYSGYLTIQKQAINNFQGKVMLQTISSRQGMVTQFALADGTKVWLNSGSELQFPSRFDGDRREVILKGEAFFEVTKNEKQSFRVNANELKVDVLGTSFNVVSFDSDTQSEVVLVTGKVALTSENGQSKTAYGTLHSGQRAIYEKENQKVITQEVDVEKYIAWRDGNLIFRDDSMEDVVKRLSRWFNVEITINDPEIKNYIYKATFRNENLVQVLNLLKLSAPIDYQITDRESQPNGDFTKQKVCLMKKKS
ncbi:MAG TPA: FecR domain-containing protein [Prolixibacteraceae bacterium]|jgi:ferric-dicitrate binding protein FerR (iron transport regulator)